MESCVIQYLKILPRILDLEAEHHMVTKEELHILVQLVVRLEEHLRIPVQLVVDLHIPMMAELVELHHIPMLVKHYMFKHYLHNQLVEQHFHSKRMRHLLNHLPMFIDLSVFFYIPHHMRNINQLESIL